MVNDGIALKPFINLGFKSGESRDYLKLPQKKKILLFFGLIKEVKGLELLLEAFKLVKDAPEPLKVVEVVTPVITKPC